MEESLASPNKFCPGDGLSPHEISRYGIFCSCKGFPAQKRSTHFTGKLSLHSCGLSEFLPGDSSQCVCSRGRIDVHKQQTDAQNQPLPTHDVKRQENFGEQFADVLHHLDFSCNTTDSQLLAALLRGCGNSKILSDGKRIHAHIVKSRHEHDVFLGNLLVQMYAKCTALDDARAVFDSMKQKNVFSWTIMIGAYAEHGKGREALILAQQLQLDGVVPDKVSFVTILSVCADQGALLEGHNMHAYIIHTGMEYDVIVGNAIVNMYSKCGYLEDAQRMFHKLPERSVISWNGMITAYAQHGQCKEALEVFQEMEAAGEVASLVTCVSVLSAYASQGALAEGRIMHVHIAKSAFDLDGILGNALINMYGKCGSTHDAQAVFQKMAKRNVLSWNAIIGAYAQHGQGDMGLSLLHEMKLEGVIPDHITFINLLDACAKQAAIEQGQEVHACIVDSGLEVDVVVGTALVHMYSKCESLDRACCQFDKMHQRDVISWNAMIAAYAQHGESEEALQLFQQMQVEQVRPDTFTFVSILDACANQAALAEGKQIHAYLLSSSFEINVVVETALLNMYGKCGSLVDAHRIFHVMSRHDLISWNALMAACAQHGQGQAALLLFQEMQLKGALPDDSTFISILDACSSIPALVEGKQIHSVIIESGFESNAVGTAIITMYGKCGSLEDALRMFDRIHDRDVVSWTAIITTCAQHGQGKEALHLFDQMKLEGNIPNERTFASVLSVCSHSGFTDQGWQCFHSMIEDYGITPTVDHYNCMIDLLARAGHVNEAEDFLHNMPFCPNAMSWITLLSVCRNNLDVERAERAAGHVFELDPENDAAYVLLSNIYAAVGRWEDVAKMRRRMEVQGVKKQPGCSSIEVDNRLHEFFVGGRSHPQKEEIFAELGRLSRQMKNEGYMPDTKVILHDIEEGEKEDLLFRHSEKLAIVFGLLNTPPGTPLRVFKNLRVCPDCHSAAKFISKIVDRDIILRDASRFHHFRNGTCSCADYW